MYTRRMIQTRTALVGGFILLSVAASISLARTPGPERVGGGAVSAEPKAAALVPSAASASAPPGVSSAPSAPASDFLGVILARASVDLAARFDGRIRAVHVRLGDVVPAGASVASLDIPTLRFDLNMAEAEVHAAEVAQSRAAVELTQAEERLGRRRALSAEALATGEDLAAATYQQRLAEVQVQSARAQLAGKRARVGQLRKNTDDTEIRAPFEAIVAARYVDPGANVTAATPIVRLLSARDFFVRFAVPEESAARLSVGAPVEVSLGGAAPPRPASTLHGAVDKVSPEVDAASRMIIVEARLDAAALDMKARSGEMARVSIEEKR
ncbi:MAG: efflux RND transporter periplasmic adaptor subunit [Byssovorax sp.]